MTNQLIMQAFEWYLPADGNHWKTVKASIPQLQHLGVTELWLPPAFKGTGINDVGYGVYDLFDLGEFDQNGTVITKYGSKQEYLDLITALKEAAIKPIADIVLNHKANGDHKERFFVIKMNSENRQEALTEPYEIEGWTGFDFPGRNGCYNDFKWHWYHFTGLDYDAKNNETGIYMITGDNKGWANNEQFALVDVGLHMSFFNASHQGKDFDLTHIFEGSLVASRPDLAITFVENHDTQRGQALESTVEDWFKPLAYGLILLRQEGKPCLFYGDYYGISGDFAQASFKEVLDKLTLLRKEAVYGEQVDYFDHANCIAWTCLGDEEHPHPLAVILSNGDEGWKHVEIGQDFVGQTFVDYLGHCSEKVVVAEDGWLDIKVETGSISAWVPEERSF